MLTELKAFSPWHDIPELILSENGRAETDLIQIRNIEGLDPVEADVNQTPFGSIDGTAYVGSSVQSRNIVLTLRPNPNWDNWTYESLRRLLYKYFAPKKPTKLEFYSDDIAAVEIEGITEKVSVNQFSNDPEVQVSIICPYPYFTSLNPIVRTGQAVRSGSPPEEIVYNGTVETGIKVKLTTLTTPYPTFIEIQVGDPAITFFTVNAGIDNTAYFEVSSVDMQKYVETVKYADGVITNLLSKVIKEGSSWPRFEPGKNDFSVITDQGIQDWELTYFERFGGL